MISVTQALAARRAALAAAALAAALAAHAAAAGGLHLTATAPLAWGWIVILAALCGPRHASWRTRGALRLTLALVAAQVAAHLAMGAAPWAFGLEVHHATPALTPAALGAHLAAAAVLAVLLAHAERLLAAALWVAGAIRRRLAPRAPTRRPPLPVAGRAPGARPRPAVLALACRGPPPAVTA